jgi:prepilin-type processing-associated H-X9-DG protein
VRAERVLRSVLKAVSVPLCSQPTKKRTLIHSLALVIGVSARLVGSAVAQPAITCDQLRWGHFPSLRQCDEAVRFYGITNCVALIHDWQRSGYDNALPMHYPANASYGGDAGMSNATVGCIPAWARSSKPARALSASLTDWTADLHQFRGNLLFADSHVEERRGATTRMAAAELLLPTTNRAVAQFPTLTRPGAAFVLAPTSPSTVSSTPNSGAPPAAARVRPEPKLGFSSDIHTQPVRSNTILTDSPSLNAARVPPARATGSEPGSVREPRPSHRFTGYPLLWLLLLLLLLAISAFAIRSWAHTRNKMPGWRNLRERRAHWTARTRRPWSR